MKRRRITPTVPAPAPAPAPVPDRFYPSPRWSGEILDCSMPMTFDQFSRCSYDCLYCFSYFQRSVRHLNPLQNKDGKRELYTHEAPYPVNVPEIKAIFSGEKRSQFSGYIDEKVWMQWGGLSDPFDEFERKQGVGLELLRYFSALQYPICFSTKGTWWVYDERYMELFRRNRERWNVKFSIINLDAERSRKIERGCPPPADRLKAMRELYESGCSVTLRLRPFIIGLSDRDDEYLELIAQAHEQGATALSTEFFCLEGRIIDRTRYDKMSEVLGFDLLDFYKRNSPKRGGYMRLNWKIKEPYVNKMERLCRTLGMRFYVSDAHHKDRCATGSCCGLPEGSNYHRGQFTQAIVIARQRGEVRFSDIEPYILRCFKNIKATQATNGLNFMRGSPGQRARFKDFTIYDMFRYFWNEPQDAKSPYKYFAGALRPDRIDGDGNVVYRFHGYQEPAKGGELI